MPTAEAKRSVRTGSSSRGSRANYVEVARAARDVSSHARPTSSRSQRGRTFLDLSKLGERGATPARPRSRWRTIQQHRRRARARRVHRHRPNKLIAKMASGVNKPRGLTVLDEEEFRQLFWPGTCRKNLGVGPKMSEHLKRMGIPHRRRSRPRGRADARASFGAVGVHLKHAAWGATRPRRAVPRGRGPESMGHEVTLPGQPREAFLEGTLLQLADQVARRLRGEASSRARGDLKLPATSTRARTITRQKALTASVDDHLAIFEVAKALWRELEGRALRLLGVSAGARARGGRNGAKLFAGTTAKKTLQEALDKVRDKLGEASVVPAGLAFTHRRGTGHVPFGAMKRRDASAPGAQGRSRPQAYSITRRRRRVAGEAHAARPGSGRARERVAGGVRGARRHVRATRSPTGSDHSIRPAPGGDFLPLRHAVLVRRGEDSTYYGIQEAARARCDAAQDAGRLPLRGETQPGDDARARDRRGCTATSSARSSRSRTQASTTACSRSSRGASGATDRTRHTSEFLRGVPGRAAVGGGSPALLVGCIPRWGWLRERQTRLLRRGQARAARLVPPLRARDHRTRRTHCASTDATRRRGGRSGRRPLRLTTRSAGFLLSAFERIHKTVGTGGSRPTVLQQLPRRAGRANINSWKNCAARQTRGVGDSPRGCRRRAVDARGAGR